MTAEFHALFDHGLVAITPDYHVRVSPTIRQRWSNGKRYYAYDGQPLAHLPEAAECRPSADALKWRLRSLYRE